MKEKIFEIIRNACALEENIDEKTKLDEISLNSLSFIEVIVKIEEEFDIEFDFEEVDFTNWQTVEEIIKKVKELSNEKGKKSN